MPPSTVEERRAWLSAYIASGMTQAEFCRAHRAEGGPSERTLRAWLATSTASPPGPTELRPALLRAARALALASAEVDRVLDGHGWTDQDAEAAAGEGRHAAQGGPANGDDGAYTVQPADHAAVDAPAAVAAPEPSLHVVEAGDAVLPVPAAGLGGSVRRVRFFDAFD